MAQLPLSKAGSVAHTLLFLVMCAYLLTIPLGRDAAPVIRQLLLGACVLAMGAVLALAPGSLRGLRLVAPVVACAISYAVSTWASSNVELSLRNGVFMPIAIFLFVAIQLSLISHWHLRFLGLVLAIVIAGVCVDVLMHAIWGMSLLSDHAFWHGRPRGSIPHPNDIALVPLFLPLALAGVAPQAGKLRAVSGASLVLLAFTGVLATQSRNGLLGMFIAAALWAAVTFRSRVTLGLLASGVIALALATAANLWNLQARLATFGHLGNDGRLGLWAVGTQMFRESPLLGKGNHVFSQYYPAYLSKVALPSGYSPEVAYIPWVHNLYLEALAERGIIGFMTSAWLIIAIFLAARFTMRDRTVGPFARAVIASTAALLVMGVSDLTVLKDWVVLAIALLAAVAGALGRVAKMQHHTTVTAGGARPT